MNKLAAHILKEDELNALILTEVENGIATITLNRPERLNALTRELLMSLSDALAGVAKDESIRVVCLTGAGRAFSAGQDLSERDPRVHEHPFDLEALQQELFFPVLYQITEMEKPVIAKVNGLAAGAGSSLALAADIVIASQTAQFIQSFSKVGLSVDTGGGWQLAHALGPARAKAVLMLGEALSAEEAEAAGLIWRSVPDEHMDAAGLELCARLRATPRLALRGIKKAVGAALEAPDLRSYLDEEARLQGEAGRSPDYPEGVLSFLEKRPAKFK